VVEFSARRSTMLTGLYRDSPLSLQVSSSVVYQLCQDRSLVRALLTNCPTFDPAHTEIMGRDSVVGIQTWQRDGRSGVRNLTEAIYFFLKTSRWALGFGMSPVQWVSSFSRK